MSDKTVDLNSFTIFLEGDLATETQWVARLDKNTGIFKELLSDGILRSAGNLLGRRVFTLNFVGLLSIGARVWFSFPKACQSTSWSDATTILKTIAEYRRNTSRVATTADFSSSADRLYGGNLVDAFMSLVVWTLDRGFHHGAVVNTSSFNDGIDWARTVSETVAIHTNTSVIYPEPIKRVTSYELSDLAEVQAFALLDMRKRLDSLSDVLLPHLEDLWEECREVLSYGQASLHSDAIEQILDYHQSTTNRDEDLELVALLSDWFSLNLSAGEPLLAYGITSFHTVWENMCVTAMSSFGKAVIHANIASQPSYLIHGREVPLAPQRPDILLQRGDDILLGDAKWYLLDKTMLPKTPDAIKQVMYELSVDPKLRVLANVFLLPSENDDKWWSFVGNLRLLRDLCDDDRYKSVAVFGVNWKYLAEIYLHHRRFPETFYEDLLKSRLQYKPI